MTDVLAEILATVHLQSTVYCQSEISTTGWGLWFAAQPSATFHVIRHGECWLLMEGQADPLRLQGGDLIVLPGGAAHQIKDTPASAILENIDLSDYQGKGCLLLRWGELPPTTTLICGTFQAQGQDLLSLSQMLPPLLRFSRAENTANGLQPTLEALLNEANAQRPGSQTILTRLADVLFVQVLRAWIAASEHRAVGWLAGLRDAQIAQALAHIHRAPAHPWRVGSLARAVAMSRSAFAERFSNLVGEPPLTYLRRWRIALARTRLRETDSSMIEIAQAVGYGSEAAFSKAFKDVVGITPGMYRRHTRSER